MKKALVLMAALSLLVSLTACSGKEEDSSQSVVSVASQSEASSTSVADSSVASSMATSDDISVAGSWVLSGVIQGDTVITVEELTKQAEAMEGMEAVNSIFNMQYIFNEDGTGNISMDEMLDMSGIDSSFTWEIVGNNIVLKESNGSTAEMTYNAQDDTLTMMADEESGVILSRVK